MEIALSTHVILGLSILQTGAHLTQEAVKARKASVRPITIDDYLPDFPIGKMINPEQAGGRLSDYKDRVLIGACSIWNPYESSLVIN